jgi:hypothetical protein
MIRCESYLVQCLNAGMEGSHRITHPSPRGVLTSYRLIGEEDWSATTN